jgi:hypothetical protein
LLPPTGKKATWTGMTRNLYETGKIVESWWNKQEPKNLEMPSRCKKIDTSSVDLILVKIKDCCIEFL